MAFVVYFNNNENKKPIHSERNGFFALIVRYYLLNTSSDSIPEPGINLSNHLV